MTDTLEQEATPLASPAPVTDYQAGAFVRPRRVRSTWPTTLLIWVGAAAATALVVLALVFHAQGGRWFIVQTPSMGTTAPVGTLVLSTPVDVADLHVGDVITFHPPTERSKVYTHRIAAFDSAGIATRGDINGATDPWRLSQTDLIGKTTTIVPALGRLVRALPILIVGAAFVVLATRLIGNPARRMSYRILGFSLLSSLTVYVLHPFVGLVVLTTSATGTGGVTAQIVSTGLLPIRATAKGGTSVDLVSGQVGQLTVDKVTDLAHYSVSSALHLTLPQWIVFGVVCAIPMLWCFIVGLPSAPEAPVLSVPRQTEAEAYLAEQAAPEQAAPEHSAPEHSAATPGTDEATS